MNPFEVDVKPKDNLELIINRVEELEIEVREKKRLEDMLKKFKQSLVEEVEKRGWTEFSWRTPNDTKFTYVKPLEQKATVKRKFCEGLFKKDYPELYEKYCKDLEDVTSGRKSYMRVTLPKE